MPSSAKPISVALEGDAYRKKLTNEQDHFRDLDHVHDLPPIFHYWADTYVRPMAEEYGFTNAEDLYVKYLVRAAEKCGGASPAFLSVGSGNCDAEIRVARRLRESGLARFTIECLDLNPVMLDRGRAQAEEAGLADCFVFTEADFNHWKATEQYAAVVANQSLHHVVALETLFDEIKRSLRPEGYFISSDMIGRNGHQRWPEAFRAVQRFWKELPIEYRYNRTFDRYEEEYLEHDCSVEGFEGIRAQDILPWLVERFDFHLFVGFGNVVNVFLDRRFGSNFDANAGWDRGFIDRVHAFDEQGLLGGELTPTQMFAVMTTEACTEHLFSRGLTPEACIRKPDADGSTESRELTIATSSMRPKDEGGTLYQQQWKAVQGRSPYRWSAEGLPRDLTLSTSGMLAGELRVPGVFTPVIEVADSSSPSVKATQRYTIFVDDKQITACLRVTSPALLPSGTEGRNHSQQLTAAGGRPPYLWAVPDGALPAGLQLNARAGAITGAPTASGTYPFTLQVADSASEATASDHVLTIYLDSGPRRLVLPQIACGSGWRTHLHLLNPSSSEAEVTIVFRSNDGMPLKLPVTVDGPGSPERSCTGEVRDTIPPRSSLHVATPDGHAATHVGWAEVLHSGPVSGYAMFEHLTSPGVPADLLYSLAPSLLMPFDNTSGSKVGLALMNGDPLAPVSVAVTIWDADWTQLQTARLDLAPSGHLSFMLAERYPAAAGRAGLIEFETAAQGKLGGLGLQFGADGRFTLIPRLVPAKPA